MRSKFEHWYENDWNHRFREITKTQSTVLSTEIVETVRSPDS